MTVNNYVVTSGTLTWSEAPGLFALNRGDGGQHWWW